MQGPDRAVPGLPGSTLGRLGTQKSKYPYCSFSLRDETWTKGIKGQGIKGRLNLSVAPAVLGPFKKEEGQWEGRGMAWKEAGVRCMCKGGQGRV